MIGDGRHELPHFVEAVMFGAHRRRPDVGVESAAYVVLVRHDR